MNHLLKGMLIAGAVMATTATGWAAEVLLQSAHSGKFVQILNGRLAASAIDPQRALRLDSVRLNGNRIAFRDIRGASYVRAGVGQGTFLASGSPHIRGWETFELVSMNNGKIALRSVQNGRYVRAGVGQNSLLAAVSDRAASWQMFRLVSPRDAVAQSGGQNQSQPDLRDIVGTYRITHATTRDLRLGNVPQHLARRAQLSLDASGRISATSGCNTASGTTRINNGRVTMTSQVLITRRGCPDQQQLHFELDVVRSLNDSSAVSRSGNTITFKNAAGTSLLKLSRL